MVAVVVNRFVKDCDPIEAENPWDNQVPVDVEKVFLVRVHNLYHIIRSLSSTLALANRPHPKEDFVVLYAL